MYYSSDNMVEKEKKKKLSASTFALFGVTGLTTTPPLLSTFSHDSELSEYWMPEMSSIQAFFFYGTAGILDPTNIADVPVWKNKGFTTRVAFGLMLLRATVGAGIVGVLVDPLYKYTGPDVGDPMAPSLILFKEVAEPIGSPGPLSWVFKKWTRTGIYG